MLCRILFKPQPLILKSLYNITCTIREKTNDGVFACEQAAATGKPVSISSMCAVFAETEIIGLLAQGTAPADIAAGVYLSIARRMRGLAARIPLKGECTFTGGLATSPAFSGLLAAELGVPVNVPDDPQTVGALGAALVAAR